MVQFVDVKPSSNTRASSPSFIAQHDVMTSHHDTSVSAPVSMSLNAAYQSMLSSAHTPHVMNNAGALSTYALSKPDINASGDMTSSAHAMTHPITAIQNVMMQNFLNTSHHVNAATSHYAFPTSHHAASNDVKAEDERVSPARSVKTEHDDTAAAAARVVSPH